MSKKAKKQPASGAPLFISISRLFETVSTVVTNINKEIKLSIGSDILRNFCKLIRIYKNAYETDEDKDKIVFIKEFIDEIEYNELLIKMLFNSRFIGIKQMSNMSILIGDIKTQMYKWKLSVENRLNNDNISENN